VPVCHVIPFPQNRKFVGRGEQLLALQQKLFIQSDSQRIALVGLGGVGKTQVALQFAYWTKEHRPEYSIFWIPALSAESFDQACGDLVRRLAITNTADNEDPKESVRRYLSLERAGKWLLIVDNADDTDMLDGLLSDYGGISEFFPAHEDRLVVFTTRHEEAAGSLAGSNTIPLLKMNRQEACTLFEKSLTRRDSLGDDAITMTLLEELTFHPLAITQAAAYLNMTRASIPKYLQLVRGAETDLVGLMSREFRDSTRYSGARNAVATTWLVSFDQIRTANPHAADLLCFISRIEPRAIPLSLLPNLQSEEQQVFSLGTLHSYAFVTRRGDSDMYDMHRLVHLATRIWIQQDKRAIEVSEQATRHLAEIFPSDDYTNRTIWREYLPHAVRLLQDGETIAMEERYNLCMEMGKCLYMDGRISESVRWLSETYQWAKECLPEEHPSRLESQHELAGSYQADGQVKKAVQLLEHIVAIKGKTLAEEHPDRLASQHELAGAYRADGQVKKAVQLLEHVVAIKGKTLAEEHPDRLASQHALAGAYKADGQVKKAVQLLEHIVAIMRKTLAEEHPDRLASQHALAGAYQADGQVKKAVQLLEHVVAIEGKTLAEEHPSRLASQHALARAYEADGQVQKAVQLLEHVVAIKDSTMREGHPSRVVSHNLLASMYKLLA
jgi:tetratricopeptide (TPR) repeat protein